MSLRDIATELKQEAESARRATEETEKRAQAHSRRVSYYKEFGDKWFAELAKQIETSEESFNEIAGDQAKLNAQLNVGPGAYSIAIELVRQNAALIDANPRCSVVQKHDDLKVLIELIEKSKASILECDVRIADFTEFKVQVILKNQKDVIDEKATDREYKRDPENFFPTFKTVTSEERKVFTTTEFAEFILIHFVEFTRKKRLA
jgi:hypothetical protein